MKNRFFLLACLIICSLKVSGQIVIPTDMSKLEKTPEVLELYKSAIEYVLLYENEVDSLQKAITNLDKAIALNEDILHTRIYKSEILFRMGREEESLSLLDSICRRDDCPLDVLLLAGMLHEKKGDDERADKFYGQILTKSSSVVNGGECSLKDFIRHLFFKYVKDNKVMTMEEIKALLPENLKDTNDATIRKEIAFLYGKFDKESYIRNLWNFKAKRGIKMLKSFYTRYITNMQENKNEANKELRSECISPEVLAWLPAFMERRGFDPIINAQDVNEAMLKSLKIEPLERPDWYMVNYSWDGKDETSIVVKLESINQKWMISYIIPLGKK